MKKALYFLISLFIVVCSCWFAWTCFYESRPMVVFQNISVGDTEESLVGVLKSQGIAFHKVHSEGKTVYSHHDGFVGLCFYYVQNGRVISKAVD